MAYNDRRVIWISKHTNMCMQYVLRKTKIEFHFETFFHDNSLRALRTLLHVTNQSVQTRQKSLKIEIVPPKSRNTRSHTLIYMDLYFIITCKCDVYFRVPEVWMAPEVVLVRQASLWVWKLHFVPTTRNINPHSSLPLTELTDIRYRWLSCYLCVCPCS